VIHGRRIFVSACLRWHSVRILGNPQQTPLQRLVAMGRRFCWIRNTLAGSLVTHAYLFLTSRPASQQ
jgi:hypothetical protein